LFCRDKHEIIPRWAKSEAKYKINTHSSFWPKQSKEKREKSPLTYPKLGQHALGMKPGNNRRPTCQSRAGEAAAKA
jgi:hypothetical protein